MFVVWFCVCMFWYFYDFVRLGFFVVVWFIYCTFFNFWYVFLYYLMFIYVYIQNQFVWLCVCVVL